MKIKFTRDCIAFGKAVKKGTVLEVPADCLKDGRYLLRMGMAEKVSESSVDDSDEADGSENNSEGSGV